MPLVSGGRPEAGDQIVHRQAIGRRHMIERHPGPQTAHLRAAGLIGRSQQQVRAVTAQAEQDRRERAQHDHRQENSAAAVRSLSAALRWSRASVHSATAATNARRPATRPARNRARAFPRDGSARCARVPSSRPPTARSGRSPRRHSRNSLANAGSAGRSAAPACSGKSPPNRARPAAARARMPEETFVVRSLSADKVRG